jgi:hypothetical protein
MAPEACDRALGERLLSTEELGPVPHGRRVFTYWSTIVGSPAYHGIHQKIKHFISAVFEGQSRRLAIRSSKDLGELVKYHLTLNLSRFVRVRLYSLLPNFVVVL